MKRSCNFQMNPAFKIGLLLMTAGLFVRNVLALEGPVAAAAHFISGAACGLVLLGLLYGSPRTRPMFGRFHAFKLRLLGRGNAN